MTPTIIVQCPQGHPLRIGKHTGHQTRITPNGPSATPRAVCPKHGTVIAVRSGKIARHGHVDHPQLRLEPTMRLAEYLDPQPEPKPDTKPKQIAHAKPAPTPTKTEERDTKPDKKPTTSKDDKDTKGKDKTA